MAAIAHTTIRTSAATAGFSLFFTFHQRANCQSNNCSQNATDQNSRPIFCKPQKHVFPPRIIKFRCRTIERSTLSSRRADILLRRKSVPCAGSLLQQLCRQRPWFYRLSKTVNDFVYQARFQKLSETGLRLVLPFSLVLLRSSKNFFNHAFTSYHQTSPC